MKRIFIWTFALTLVAAGAVLQGRKTETSHAEPFGKSDQTRTTTAAFRDGAYLGKLAARGQESRHVSASRWASEADRQLFAAGYERGYTDGAFRDGLYLGKLNARDGNEQHIATGRWSTGKNRASFIDGYHRAYTESSTANMQQTRETEFATLNARKP
jgi:hypothetical protein